MGPVYLYRCQCTQIAAETYDFRGYVKVLGHYPACLQVVPTYSASIADAWLVVEVMERKEYEVELIFTPSNGWSVTFSGKTFGLASETTKSLPHLICLAALKAVQKGTP